MLAQTSLDEAGGAVGGSGAPSGYDGPAGVAGLRALADLEGGTAEQYFTCGNALLRVGDCEAAIRAYDRAIGLEPAVREPHLNKAVAQIRTARYPEAVATFEALLRHHPGP